MILNKIVDWNIARNNLAFDPESELKMLQEELDEFEEASIFKSYHDSEGFLVELTEEEQEHKTIDGLADLIVVACGGIFKKGYDPNLAMLEVLKEISSRQQDPRQAELWALNGAQGKWQKNTKQDPSTLYKANYNNCLYKETNHRAELEELREDLKNG
jgi:hypothetical protein